MTDGVLAMVSDDLIDSVASCAAAAGFELIESGAGPRSRAWRTARAVVVDAEHAVRAHDQRWPRHPRVALICEAAAPQEVWRSAAELGVSCVAEFPGAEAELVRWLTESRRAGSGTGAVVGLVAAHGGAGATVLAAATAIVAARRHRVLLLDVNEVGAGVDFTLGTETADGLRWQDLTAAGGQISAESLHDALPHPVSGVSVLAVRADDPRPVPASSVAAVIDAGRTAGDTVIIDFPRAETAVVQEVVAALDVAALVTSATIVGAAAAKSTTRRLLDGTTTELAVRGPAMGALRAADVVAAVGLPLLTSYRPDPRLPSRLETTGLNRLLRKPLARAATDIHRRATGVAKAAR